jgi:cyclophilin family peptidyl-prolyl cis-trans isomerase
VRDRLAPLHQPHLDGRYTLFGEIVEGLDVVTSMIEGERIVRVVVER